MTMAQVDRKLLEVLVCPQSHAPLVCEGDWLYSTDPKTRRKYPIRDALPIMLVEESEEASPGEFDRVMANAKHKVEKSTDSETK